MTGLGRCVGGMVTAQSFNDNTVSPVYGVSTTGTARRVLRLVGRDLTMDSRDYFIPAVERILGSLASSVRPPA